tara:strand:- start:495 stop:1793 length:1299 start_codon:yes stop_codon:yes gene_type:complete
MKKTILMNDLNDQINQYDNQIYDMIKKLNVQNITENYYEKEEIKNLCITILGNIFEFYEIQNGNDSLSKSKRLYIQNFLENRISEKCSMYEKRLEKKKNIKEIVENLKNLELPEQRSKEWYEIREGILTASSLADALGKGHFNTRESLLIDKTSKEKKKYFTNEIIQWGVKYEPIATNFYEEMNQLKIVEFGLVPHPEFPIFGASPDGICDVDSSVDYIGRMLEIKCPPVRKFWEKPGEVPLHYWMQMQGQLETCDLEECDFLQVKILEYSNETEYNEDNYIENDTMKEGYSKTGYPKGLVIELIDGEGDEKTYDYLYPEFYLSSKELKDWAEKEIKDYEKKYKECHYRWWRIERYDCTLVGRDVEWWNENALKIIEFWEDVEFYRKEGNQQLIDKKANRKKKRAESKKKKQINVIKIENIPYMLDTSSDDD